MGFAWSFLPKIEGRDISGTISIHHKASTSEISGIGIDDGKGKFDSNGCIYGVSTFFEDIYPDLRGQWMGGDDGSVFKFVCGDMLLLFGIVARQQNKSDQAQLKKIVYHNCQKVFSIS